MRGRFAPSPTGHLHLGNLRTALLAFLFARTQGSGFVLRFEDLDEPAVRAEYYDSQRRDLEQLGLDWDDELRQTDHVDRYRAAIDQLVLEGRCYPCFCSRREIQEAARAPHGELPDGAYPGTCSDLSAGQRGERVDTGRIPALRLRTDGREVSFVDRVCGPTTGRIDDMVIARRDGTPAYNLVVVIDDAHQGIEQVVRADDLLSSTPRQIHLAQLLELPRPAHAHVPLVLGPSGSRLAKRDGAVTLAERLAMGQTPAQVRGWLASSLGWDEVGPEPSIEDLTRAFDPDRIQATPWQLTIDDLAAGT